MFSEKIDQLVAVLEKQELEVSIENFIVLIRGHRKKRTNDAAFSLFQAPNGVVSPQLYAELFAAYLYKNDL